jgi:hypothetical protein
MRITTYASAAAIALAMSIGTASADEQLSTSASSATVMTDAQLDAVVGAGRLTRNLVRSNRRNAFENSNGHSQALVNNGDKPGGGAGGSLRTIRDNPSK